MKTTVSERGDRPHRRIRWASLSSRLALWYAVFTFLCMSSYGAALSQFLKHELRASREENMLRRESRFISFVDTDAAEYSGRNLAQVVSHFAEASPDTDMIEILDPQGKLLYPDQDRHLPWLGANGSLPSGTTLCMSPCLATYRTEGHHWRLLTHQTTLAGIPVWILMAGSMDEHYDILHSVRTGYFLLLPLVLLGSVMGGYAMSRSSLRPVGRLTEKARSLSLTSLDGRLPVPQTGDELQSLAEAWNDLLVRLEAEVDRSSQLTTDISHDLRSSMTVILANAELSLRRSRSQQQYCATLSTIQQEATHVLTMLEDMLLATQTHEAGQQVEKMPVCFNEIAYEVFEASQAAAAIRDQKLSFNIVGEPGVDLWLQGNRSLLRRLVNVLVDNALKYTPRGGEVELSVQCSGDDPIFKVRDNGMGIPQHLKKKVFDRLFRADSARSRKEMQGSGLGLAIAKWIADVHGLKIQLQSELHRGSTFTVILTPAQILIPRSVVGEMTTDD